MKKKLLGLALAAALSVAPAVFAEEYIMSSGDELSITILKHPDLSTNTTGKNYIVRPDGFVSFPLIGNVDTKGKTVEAFRKEITERFSEYLVNPDITVNIASLGSTRVFVFGEVKMQGSHELTKSHRVLDALGAAKGFNLEAAKGRVYLIRANDVRTLAKQNAVVPVAKVEAQASEEVVQDPTAITDIEKNFKKNDKNWKQVKKLREEREKALNGKPLKMTKVSKIEKQIEYGDEALPSNVIKLDLNEYFRKGDLSQNPVLNEGDCVFIARNHRVDLKDIFSRAITAAYNIDRIQN